MAITARILATKSKEQLTGKDLLTILSGLSKEELALPVSADGCDCIGDAREVEVVVEGYTKYILVSRGLYRD